MIKVMKRQFQDMNLDVRWELVEACLLVAPFKEFRTYMKTRAARARSESSDDFDMDFAELMQTAGEPAVPVLAKLCEEAWQKRTPMPPKKAKETLRRLLQLPVLGLRELLQSIRTDQDQGHHRPKSHSNHKHVSSSFSDFEDILRSKKTSYSRRRQLQQIQVSVEDSLKEKAITWVTWNHVEQLVQVTSQESLDELIKSLRSSDDHDPILELQNSVADLSGIAREDKKNAKKNTRNSSWKRQSKSAETPSIPCTLGILCLAIGLSPVNKDGRVPRRLQDEGTWSLLMGLTGSVGDFTNFYSRVQALLQELVRSDNLAGQAAVTPLHRKSYHAV